MPENTSIQTIENPSADIQVYHPSEIVDIFNDFLSRTSMGTKVVLVTGIYFKTARQAYSGYYYDTLKDQNSDQELSVKVPQTLRDEMENGSLVTIGGTIFRQPGNRGNIQLGLKVSRVETLQQQAVSEEDMKRAELRASKTQRGYVNVDSLLEGILMKGQRPKVALIFATSSITMSDFDAGKHAAEASMDFDEYRVNFASARDLCDLLDHVDTQSYDVLALVRGGGSGIEHLDDLSVIEKVVGLTTPLICAVGHVEEKLFLKLVADKVAPTPNGLGQWFSDVAEKISKTRAESLAVITEQVKKQFQERIETQEKQNKELQGKLDAITKQAGETTKTHGEQMKALNATLESFKKESAAQASKQQETLNKLQKSNSELLTKNTELNNQMASYRARIAELENGKGKGNGALIAVIVIAIIIVIIAFATR